MEPSKKLSIYFYERKILYTICCLMKNSFLKKKMKADNNLYEKKTIENMKNREIFSEGTPLA